MAAVHPHALQDTFLEHVRKHDVPVTVFLASGIRLQGTVAGFDSYALLLVISAFDTLLQNGAERQAGYERPLSQPRPACPPAPCCPPSSAPACLPSQPRRPRWLGTTCSAPA